MDVTGTTTASFVGLQLPKTLWLAFLAQASRTEMMKMIFLVVIYPYRRGSN